MKRIVTLVFVLLLATTLSFAAEKKVAPTKPAPTVEKKTDAAPAAAKADLVDINTAAEAELKAIPGIGDTYAKQIVAGRPYANKAQLKSKKILPSAVYDKVKDRIIAKQPKK